MKIENLIANLQRIRHEHYLSTGSGTGKAPEELDVLFMSEVNQKPVTEVELKNGRVLIS